MTSPVVLVVRDGWGLSDHRQGNAVLVAKTPNTDRFKSEYPWTVLDASGRAVGLPDGYQGSSEVGHLNIGAGRVVLQELTRVNDAISTGELWESAPWRELVSTWTENRSTLHLMGLLQDEGVHAHMNHLFSIMRRARREWSTGRIVIHPFLDGRDTPPRSCIGYLQCLQEVADEIGDCTMGTVMGRYYGMDRSRSWNLTDAAMNCIARGVGIRASDPVSAVEGSYENDTTPDGVEMFDEYIPPYCIGDYRGLEAGDVVLHTNYRQDRAIQLSRAFLDDEYPGEVDLPDIAYFGLTRYYDGFTGTIIPPMDTGSGMDNLLGKVISDAGMRQLRIAETQKYRHVTSFFNGKSTVPFPGEDRIEVTSDIDPSTYASNPEMEALRVTGELLSVLDDNPYSFIMVNFANGDMVGHTGDFDAAVRAIEVVDRCLGVLVKRLLELNARIMITSDHGNAEQMLDETGGEVQTSHSLNPVEFIYIDGDTEGVSLRKRGTLSDIAPTTLFLLGLRQPEEMTASNLLMVET